MAFDGRSTLSALRRFWTRSVRNCALLACTAAIAGLMAACQDESLSNARAYKPIPQETLDLMEKKGTSRYAPMLIRTYKKEAEFEIWKQKQDGHYVLLKTYPMCRWSGQLGPKTREGDRQVPEGFYTITPGQMNPHSNYYLSFNVGYPNAYDKVHNYSGGLIMVHGACSSAGCFSMTDDQISEIYAVSRDSFAGGQREIQMQSLPFRMNADNLAKFRLDPNLPFWKELKKGTDQFEVTQQTVRVGVCNRHYVFGADAASNAKMDPEGSCPPLKLDEQVAQAAAAKEQADEAQVAELVAKGVQPIKLVYADGGQHPDFATRGGDVSRPEALAQGPTEIPLLDKSTAAAVRVANGASSAPGSAAGSTAGTLAGLQANRMMAAAPPAPASTPAPLVMGARAAPSSGAMINRYNAPTVTSAPTRMAAAPEAAPAPAPAQTASAETENAFFKKWLSLGQSDDKKLEDVANAPAGPPVQITPAVVAKVAPQPPRRPDVKAVTAPSSATAAAKPVAGKPKTVSGTAGPETAQASSRQASSGQASSGQTSDRQAVLRNLPNLGSTSTGPSPDGFSAISPSGR